MVARKFDLFLFFANARLGSTLEEITRGCVNKAKSSRVWSSGVDRLKQVVLAERTNFLKFYSCFVEHPKTERTQRPAWCSQLEVV